MMQYNQKKIVVTQIWKTASALRNQTGIL